MKKNILYIALACLSMGMFTACDNDPIDSCSKHVYGEGETVYLRTDADARKDVSLQFIVDKVTPGTISLSDYSELIKDKLGMTVDELVAGVQDGTVKFLNINSTRANWDNTEPTTQSGGLLGWQYDETGTMVTTDAYAAIGLDAASKSIVVTVPTDAQVGTEFTVNVGFAKVNGTDYDDYVRFCISSSVIDLTRIYKSVDLSGDWAEEFAYFDDAETQIDYNFGMTVDDFWSAVKTGDIVMYPVGSDGKWITDKEYCSDFQDAGYEEYGGYWIGTNGSVVDSDSDADYYLENIEGSLGVGRPGGIAAGLRNVHVVYADKNDRTKYIEFIVTANFQ